MRRLVDSVLVDLDRTLRTVRFAAPSLLFETLGDGRFDDHAVPPLIVCKQLRSEFVAATVTDASVPVQPDFQRGSQVSGRY